ncbi:MAG: hypothetical protein DELT_01713 [Desulfovibrio sp.]
MREPTMIATHLATHLKGMQAIGEVFGVSRRTVRAWVAAGAPIRMIGKKFQANYYELWQWIGENKGRA